MAVNLGGLRDIFKIPELSRRIFATLGFLALYRVGIHVPTPGINSASLADFFEKMKGTLFGMWDLFAGGALSQASVFALGIMPYITASIIIQMLVPVVPYLEKISKEEGEEGRRKIVQFTRYGTILIALIQSLGIAKVLEMPGNFGGIIMVDSPGWAFRIMTIITMTAGTTFIMWIGEQISEKGIGNGISLIIFAGILARSPGDVLKTLTLVKNKQMSIPLLIFIIIFAVAIVAGIILITQAQRRIPVQYAKRVIGRRIYGGQSTYVPLRVNQAGVIPIIFAVSIMQFPETISTFFLRGTESKFTEILSLFSLRNPLGMFVYAVLIIFFTYFYTAMTFNPNDMADNIKKQGGFVPGIKPGRTTADYFERIMSRIALPGGLFLAAIALLPMILERKLSLPFYFGGTSLLIVVGVALDTMGQLESHLLMRQYSGFIQKGKIKGRY
ncbi:MAG: preprotein translocase subunit SecY [Candidatus Omnitrophica bacterium]|nr:preprotein translocase subunit SecY [Candidatus Omnitrophota bacterium]MBU1048140.1 preprotein translocase subunit SecY [Candidatus Omnitrophota bacterium]MBU1630735.1 preprotein translocase subunit SecY [Candidatus Omnitrophota bacterium]MBU1889235.1 preprotein translocase subunit SecY [Candidatus Omnitrophota bacterium]